MVIKRKYINISLAVVCLALFIAIMASLMRPMSFNNSVRQRESEVMERLMTVRGAEARYRGVNGLRFCPSVDSLVMHGYMPDSVKYIPYAGGKKFEIDVSTIEGQSGNRVSVMECRAHYRDYLKGLDEEYIEELVREAEQQGRYPGLKFGDLKVASNNAASWE